MLVPTFVLVMGNYSSLFGRLPIFIPKFDCGSTALSPLRSLVFALLPFLLHAWWYLLCLLLPPLRHKIMAQIPHTPWVSTGESPPIWIHYRYPWGWYIPQRVCSLTGTRWACTYHLYWISLGSSALVCGLLPIRSLRGDGGIAWTSSPLLAPLS